MQKTEIRETINVPVTIRSKIPILLFGVIIASLVSCSNGEVYFRYNQINKGLWHRDSALTFTMDSINFNPANRYDLTIELTTADIYPYKDIWLQLEHNLDDSYLNDTLHFRLADDHDRWLGSGTGGLHQISLPYRTNIVLDTSRVYFLRISHLMSNEPLCGVEKLGVRVLIK